MPALALWLFTCLRRAPPSDIPGGWIFAALAFSTLGDIALLWKTPLGFMLGMGSFALTHVCYIRAFLGSITIEASLLRHGLLYVFPFAAYAYLVFVLIHARLEENRVLLEAFALYMLLHLATGLSAFARTIVHHVAHSSDAILAGAILFVQSDSLLAVNVYGQALPQAGLAIMLTYLLGQDPIVRGVSVRGAEIEGPAIMRS